jgi:hypothetical protein
MFSNIARVPLMTKPTAVFCLLLALAATLHADTAAFPQYDSVFTISVPDDMNAKVDSDSLVLRTKDKNDPATFIFLELAPNEARDAESARKFVEPYLENQLKRLQIEVSKRTLVAEEPINKELKGFTAEAEGKRGTNHIYYTATAFSFDEKRYFLMLSLRSYTSTVDNARFKALKQSIAASTLAAGTVGFPKDKPLFQIDLPQGWKANTRGDGTLMISSTAGQDISTLWDFALRGLTMHGNAPKGFTQSRAEELIKGLQFTDVKCTKPPTEMQIAGHKGFMTAYEGNMKGKPFFFDLAVFSLDEMNYFYVFGLAAQKTGKPALEHQSAILASVRPAKR